MEDWGNERLSYLEDQLQSEYGCSRNVISVDDGVARCWLALYISLGFEFMREISM